MVTTAADQRFTGILAEAQADSSRAYNLSRIEEGCAELGYDFEFHPVTTSTMDEARKFGLRGTVVLANHQTYGRGRHNRDWDDTEGESLLWTVNERWGLPNDPAIDSLYPTQLFVLAPSLAIENLTQDTLVRVRWLNDLTAQGKKMGGVLIENILRGAGKPYAKLFGLGVNVHQPNADEVFTKTDYGAISLDEALGHSGPSREVLLLATLREWVRIRDDVRILANPHVLARYQQLYRTHNVLIGQYVEMSGLGKDRSGKVRGRVMDTPLGRGIILDKNAHPGQAAESEREKAPGYQPDPEEIVELHTETVLRVIKEGE